MGPEVYAHGNALLALQKAVSEKPEHAAWRQTEVGGLLLGSSGAEIRIEGILPLSIEHRFGPSFWLCSEDIEMTKREIERAASDGLGEPIGHFRSQQGLPEARFNDHAIADLMPVAEPLLVVIPVSLPGPMEVVIYRRQGHAWCPLLRNQAERIPPPPGPVRPVATRPAAPRPPAPRPPAQAAIAPERSPLPAPRAASRPWMLAGAALLFGLGGGVLWNYLGPRRADPLPPVSPSFEIRGIGLEAKALGGTIVVQWNRNSAAILGSDSATLSIVDGETQRQLPLNRDQLQHGSVAYAPATGRVDLRMEVYRDSNHFIGECISVATGLVPSIPEKATDSKEARADALANPPARRKALVEGAPVEAKRSSRAPEIHEEVRKKTPGGGPVVAKSSPHPPEPVRTAILPDRPTVAAAPATAPAAVGPSVAQPAGPHAESQITYVAAIPVRKVRPAIPARLDGLIDGPVSVTVRVHIDAAGKVVKAIPEDTATAAQKALAPAAVQAALLCRFEPARRDGLPVASESMLSFDFERRPGERNR